MADNNHNNSQRPNNNSNWKNILSSLESGTLRAATKDSNGTWTANLDVKKAILEAFKAGKLVDCNGFVDKDTILPQNFSVNNKRVIRFVPGGSSVRHGAYLANGVIVMPPSFVNIGAYVDEGTMIDSHVLVGSCAQVGKNVHLSAGVQLGGVLEPIGERPVIIEDNAFIGAGSIIVEGIIVSEGAVIAPGTILSKSIPVYDLVHEKLLEKNSPIPKNAVVVSGTRRPSEKLDWASRMGLALNCAIIIKYRDEKSNSSLELEDILR